MQINGFCRSTTNSLSTITKAAHINVNTELKTETHSHTAFPKIGIKKLKFNFTSIYNTMLAFRCLLTQLVDKQNANTACAQLPLKYLVWKSNLPLKIIENIVLLCSNLIK